MLATLRRAMVSAAIFLTCGAAAHAQVQVAVTPSVRHQTIEGFGAAASVTWDAQIRALYLQPSFQDLVRDDLGMTMVRMAVHETIQPAEDLDANTLNWALFDLSPLDSAGNFIKALNAPRPGAVKAIGTIWTPPGWMKTNGAAMGGGELRTDRYAHFAKFCAAACLGIQNRYGFPVYALNLQNEPVFVEPYESCVYSTAQYRDTVKAIGTAFTTWQVPTKVFGPEDVGTVPSRWMGFVNAMAADPVAQQRIDIYAVHHYFYPAAGNETSPTAWSSIRQQLAPLGKPLWQTERSGEDPSWLGTATNTRGALYLANCIHDALVYGNCTAYLYWALTDPTPGQFGLMGLGQPTKKYYAAKQFYRYIRPGAARVETTSASANVLASAYVHDANGSTTVVLINKGATDAPVHLTIGAGGPALGAMTVIRSSNTENTVGLPAIDASSGAADLTVPANSVVTLFSSCYANCDGSTAAPNLNIGDFTCFLSAFAAGSSYANCDASTQAPALNIADFTCFLGKFAAGCTSN